MIRSIYFNGNLPYLNNLSFDEIKTAISNEKGLLWIILTSPSQNELMEILHDAFAFHPLTIEDCQSQGYQVPKIDDFGSYLFIVSHALIPPAENFDTLETNELDIFLGKNFVVTVSNGSGMLPVEDVLARIKKDERLLSNESDFLCHAILDELVDDYMPLLDKMDEEIDWMEDKVLEKPSPQILQRVLSLKHITLSLRRIISPQRETMNRLSRDDFSVISPKHRIYFRDIYDHLVRLQDLMESVRDVVSGALDIYLSVTSNKLNEVMKALTIVSTIFLPLSFFAGVYGMNFHFFPEITWKYGYLYVWGLFIAVGSFMIWYFKKKGWF